MITIFNDQEKLYYADAYQKKFDAVVISCDRLSENSFVSALNRTAFYPEGGGQPSDIGKIGETRVLHVFEKNGEILHRTDGPLIVGSAVHGEIDFDERFSNMQNHSGEHVASGIIKSMLDFDNVGFHMGSEFVTIDFNGELSDRNIKEIEELANEAVYKNLDIEILFPGESEFKSMNCRSKKDLAGDVRVVRIAGVDTCACCGTHVSKTGEIGVIKLISHQRYKGGTRISMLCGKRALRDYYDKNKSIYIISGLLSAKPSDVASAAETLLSETASLKHKLARQNLRIFKLMADAVLPCDRICVFEDALSPNELRQLCLMLCEKAKFALVLSGADSIYKYALGSLENDVSLIGKSLNEAFDGRGGGTGALMQGSICGSRESIENFFSKT